MECRRCGQQLLEDSRFCANCGAPLARSSHEPIPPPREPEPVPQPQTWQPPPPPRPPYPPVGRQPGRPNGGDRRALWIAIAALVVVFIGLTVAIPLAVRAGRGNETSSTTQAPTTQRPTTTLPPTTTTTERPTTTSTEPTTTTQPGPPGDSQGSWVEESIPAVDGEVSAVAVSEEALVTSVQDGEVTRLFAYMFATGDIVELPLDQPMAGGVDLEGSLAVWWEGRFDEASSTLVDQRIVSYMLPHGPKVEIVGDGRPKGYPQIAGSWVTWTEGQPSEVNPDELWRMPIYGITIDSTGNPVGGTTSLVPSAIAAVIGDSVWTYTLSAEYLAWEQLATEGGLDEGTYLMDLTTLQPLLVGRDVWRPSLAENVLLYWQNGIVTRELETGSERELDPNGDFPTAAPTYAAYFRAVSGNDQTSWEIVARGLTGEYEQILSEQSAPPWLSPPIAASATRVAFAVDGEVRSFSWLPR